MAAKDTEDTEVNMITPLYIKHSDIGDRDDRISTFQFCKMFDDKIDMKDIEGAQRIKGLWRIYMKNEEAKKKLFSENITVAGKKITYTMKTHSSPHLQNLAKTIEQKTTTSR